MNSFQLKQIRDAVNGSRRLSAATALSLDIEINAAITREKQHAEQEVPQQVLDVGIQPVVEIQNRQHRAKTRMYLCAVDPRHGKTIASRLLGSTLTSEQIAQRSIQFTEFVNSWFDPSYQFPVQSIVSRCQNVHL